MGFPTFPLRTYDGLNFSTFNPCPPHLFLASCDADHFAAFYNPHSQNPQMLLFLCAWCIPFVKTTYVARCSRACQKHQLRCISVIASPPPAAAAGNASDSSSPWQSRRCFAQRCGDNTTQLMKVAVSTPIIINRLGLSSCPSQVSFKLLTLWCTFKTAS